MTAEFGPKSHETNATRNINSETRIMAEVIESYGFADAYYGLTNESEEHAIIDVYRRSPSAHELPFYFALGFDAANVRAEIASRVDDSITPLRGSCIPFERFGEVRASSEQIAEIRFGDPDDVPSPFL